MKKCLLLPFLLTAILTFTSSCSQEEKRAKTYVREHIKKTLRDPGSLEIYSEKVEKENKHTFIITIDYGAKNGFGGMERRTEKFTVVGDLVIKK